MVGCLQLKTHIFYFYLAKGASPYNIKAHKRQVFAIKKRFFHKDFIGKTV